MIGERLHKLRKKKGLTQDDLASVLSLTKFTISSYENGNSDPNDESKVKIAKLFGVSLDYLLGLIDEPLPYLREKGTIIISRDLPVPVKEFIDGFKNLDDKEQAMVLERIRTLLELKEITNNSRLTEKTTVAPKKALYYSEEATVEKIVYDFRASAGLGNYLHEANSYETLIFRADEVPEKADFGVRIKGDSMEPEIFDGDIAWVKEQVQIENGQIGIFILNDESFCKKLYVDIENRTAYLKSLNPAYKPIRVTEDDFLRTVGRVIC